MDETREEITMKLMRKLAIAMATALGLVAGAAFTLPIGMPLGATTAHAQALLDINSAPKADLEGLEGIGTARADAIIKGRPYKGKDDLVQKKIITQAVYDKIKDKIIAKQK
jgi:competence protein ComEA